MKRLRSILLGEWALAVAIALFAAMVVASIFVVLGELDTRDRVVRLEEPTARERRMDIQADLRACLPSAKCRNEVLAFTRSLERVVRRDRASRDRPAARRRSRRAAPNRRPGATPPTGTPVQRSRATRPRRQARRNTPPAPAPAAMPAPNAAQTPPAAAPQQPSPPPAGDDTQVTLGFPCVDLDIAAVGC